MFVKSIVPLSFSLFYKGYEIELISNLNWEWQAQVVDLVTARARTTKLTTLEAALKDGHSLIDRLETRRRLRVNASG